MMAATFQSLLQTFFTDHLLRQRQASPHTIAGYRDTFRLLFRFATVQLGKTPSTVNTEDVQPAFIGRFLEDLEQQRGNSSRTRNARVAAIHSFFRYVAIAEPAHALLCQQVLAMPSKRHQRTPIAFLDEAEIAAVLAAPDLSTWSGRRDRALLAVAIHTGLRVSELIGLRREHVVTGAGAHIRCDGKGRKQRCPPLGRETAAVLDCWLRRDLPSETACVFPSVRGRPLSRDAVEDLVARYAHRAEQACPSWKQKRVSPHVLRHSSAMRLRTHGVDQSVIALWLGHESVETTQMYLHADLRLKEQALSRVEPLGVKPSRSSARRLRAPVLGEPLIMPSLYASSSRDPPRFPSGRTRTRHNQEPGMLAIMPATRDGIRDRAMIHMAFSAGLRVSELVGLRLNDVVLDGTPSILVRGKRRRERALPLTHDGAQALRAWMAVRGHASVPELFLNARGNHLTRAGFEYVLRKHVTPAAERCPSLRKKRVSPHVLRHTCAMITLQATHDIRKVSLWLGHASVTTTEIYTRADPTMTLEALSAVTPLTLRRGSFRPPDKLVALLKQASLCKAAAP